MISSGRPSETFCSSREISWNCAMPPLLSTIDRAPSTSSTCAAAAVSPLPRTAPSPRGAPATVVAGRISATYFSPSREVCCSRAVVPAGSSTSSLTTSDTRALRPSSVSRILETRPTATLSILTLD